MTNQEAIETIKLAQAQIEWEYPMDYAAAFDMAISALQMQEAKHSTEGSEELKQEVKNSNKSSLTQNGLDTISRQAAIDTEGLDEEVRCKMCRNQMKTDRGCDGNCKYDEKLYEKIMQILYERIKPLPSAQPEWNNHTVACLLAELFDDTCACNYNGIDEWLPEKCELLDSCPNPVGVACWEQFLKHRAERRTDE